MEVRCSSKVVIESVLGAVLHGDFHFPSYLPCKLLLVVPLGFLGVASQLALEKLIALLEENQISQGVMPIATGILIDKYYQLEGEPTQTIEVRKKVTLKQIRGEFNRVKNGEVIEGLAILGAKDSIVNAC